MDDMPKEERPLDPEVLAFVYAESVRNLTQQAGVLDGLRTRAGVLIATANVVTAILGGQAIHEVGLTSGGWMAIGAFLMAVGLAVAILLPWGKWQFGFGARDLLKGFDEREGLTMARAHRRLADLNDQSWVANAEKLERLFWAFRIASIGLAIEVALWLMVLGRITVGGLAL